MTGERGSASVLVIGFAMVVLLAVALVVDASAAYLRRQGLANLADAAALAAADGVHADRAYAALAEGRGATGDPPLDRHAAERYAAGYLDQVGAHARFPGLAVRVAVVDRAVVVRLTAPLDLPIAPPGWEGANVAADAAALVVRGD